MSYENMRIGSYGWKHPHWRGCFYPEDLPEDWELTYYSNEFSAVMVPQNYWRQGEGYDFGDWQDDAPEDFRFILEYPTIVTADESRLFAEQLSEIVDYTAGVLFSSEQVTRSGARHLSEITQSLPVYCLEALPESEFSQTMNPVWQPETPVASSLAIFDQGLSDLRQLRSWLESFAGLSEKGNGTTKTVVCMSPELKIEQLQQLKTLVELMGL